MRILDSILSTCRQVKRLTVREMYGLSDILRMQLTQLVTEIVSASPSMLHNLDLHLFSYDKDEGEGQIILEALSGSSVLPQLTHFNCSFNESWFVEGKEGNLELLCKSIRKMTSVKAIFFSNNLLSGEMCDQLIEAIVANQAENPSLIDIDLIEAGCYENFCFSPTAKSHIATLKTKGICIAETQEQHDEMIERMVDRLTQVETNKDNNS